MSATEMSAITAYSTVVQNNKGDTKIIQMRRAFFITGFNNWGKSTIISDLFNNKKRFLYGYLYSISGVNFNAQFTVQSQSNDDLWEQGYIDRINERIRTAPDGGQNLFSALCPTMETTNNFVRILTNPPFTTYDHLYIFLIEFKWEHHARLSINNIQQAGRQIPNVSFIVINDDQSLLDDNDRYIAKMRQIRRELNIIFGTP